MSSVTLNDQERHQLEHEQMLALYVAQNERLLALVRDAMPMIDELGYMRMDVHNPGNPLENEDWLRRAKAEVE